MKKIGMIGGLSWVSTAEYYRRVNEITQEVAGGVASARIVLESVNRQDYVNAVIGRQGADCVALACTEIPLLLSPEQSPLPCFSTTELHCRAAVARALGRGSD